MKFYLIVANFIARKSVTKWNKNPVSRRIFRKIRHLIEFCDEKFSRDRRERMRHYYGGVFKPHHREFVHDPEISQDYWIDTTPNLLRNLDYANWPLEDDPENYNLLGDRFGLVIRMGPCYVHMKHLETTGRPLKHDGICHAKDWGSMLELNGYHPTSLPLTGRHYIGVSPNEGEYGQVYWLEEVGHYRQKTVIEASTYLNNKHHIESFIAEECGVTWYEIC